jgi:hypothetical protein
MEKMKSDDAGRKRQVENQAQPSGIATLGTLASLSLPPPSGKRESIHPLLASLSRFDEDGRGATLH